METESEIRATPPPKQLPQTASQRIYWKDWLSKYRLVPKVGMEESVKLMRDVVEFQPIRVEM